MSATANVPPPRTEPLDETRRVQLLERELAAIPRWYSPWGHLAVTSVFGLGMVVASLVLLRDVTLDAWLTVPVAFVLANATEWWAHKHLLHHRSPLAPVLYDRHTPVHHLIYLEGDMAMASWKEMRLVLIPAYGIMLVALGTGPVAALLWWLGWPNVGLLWLATTVGYVVLYEWLHLCYHLPAGHLLGRLGLIRRLARHHATHHDPRKMQRYNFNVTVPLWDLVRGTMAPEDEATAGDGVV